MQKEASLVKISKNVFNFFKSISKNYFIVYVAIILFIVFSILSNAFFSIENIMNILRQSSMISIIAVGSFFVLVAGGIDISVGSIVGLVGIVCSYMMVNWNIHPLISILAGIVVGSLCGLLNGWLVTSRRIPPFVVTLGTMGAIRGLTYVITNSYPISGLPKSIDFIGRGSVLAVPIPVIIMIVIYIIGYIMAKKTKLGRYIFAVGGNEEASHLSGINTKSVKNLTFVIGGFLASISSIILMSRLASGQPQAGEGFEFEAITAAVIGGTSLTGGKGNIVGVFFGAVFMAILLNGMVMLNVNSYYQQMLKGIILVVAVMMDMAKKK